MKQRRVVITGLGAVTPVGNNVNDMWENLIAGKTGIDFVTKVDKELFLLRQLQK
jgi:3-oxoacyl-[acyl-carrier-protein] synthase II